MRGDAAEALRLLRDAPESLGRVFVVMAHPDDETIGLSSRLGRLADVRVVHVTDGAPRDGRDAAREGYADWPAYRDARRRELEAAMALAGIWPGRLISLGCPDKEAAANLALVARRLLMLFDGLRPDVVVTHPYEGGHPDHDATAWAVRAACDRMGEAAPVVLEAASYHLGRDGGIEPACFLGDDGGVTHELTPDERDRKRAMLDCYVSQRDVLAYFPADRECWRAAPHYDFSRPPHAGKLFYEHFDFCVDGEGFCDLVRKAADDSDV